MQEDAKLAATSDAKLQKSLDEFRAAMYDLLTWFSKRNNGKRDQDKEHRQWVSCVVCNLPQLQTLNQSSSDVLLVTDEIEDPVVAEAWKAVNDQSRVLRVLKKKHSALELVKANIAKFLTLKEHLETCERSSFEESYTKVVDECTVVDMVIKLRGGCWQNYIIDTVASASKMLNEEGESGEFEVFRPIWTQTSQIKTDEADYLASEYRKGFDMVSDIMKMTLVEFVDRIHLISDTPAVIRLPYDEKLEKYMLKRHQTFEKIVQEVHLSVFLVNLEKCRPLLIVLLQLLLSNSSHCPMSLEDG